ncbi:hypothetical protein HZB02_00930 [Candidatus Woesearchaeota archaeon]|nr:hypothetical protein [Candidatus Woesearchaeota archaeon]
MHTTAFFALSQRSGRKILLGTHSRRDIEIVERGMSTFSQFMRHYVRRFHHQLSPQQQGLIRRMISSASQPLHEKGYAEFQELLHRYQELGVNLLVRHPEPLLASYRENEGRNLSLRGMFQVWKFDHFLKEFLEMYDGSNVEIYHSGKKRTLIFAKALFAYLKRHTNQTIQEPFQHPALLGGNNLNDMKERYPELKTLLEDGMPYNHKKLTLVRKYFKQWFEESPVSRQNAGEVNGLLKGFSSHTIKLYLSHENVVGSYLHHILRYPANDALIRFTGYVITSEGFVHVEK